MHTPSSKMLPKWIFFSFFLLEKQSLSMANFECCLNKALFERFEIELNIHISLI